MVTRRFTATISFTSAYRAQQHYELVGGRDHKVAMVESLHVEAVTIGGLDLESEPHWRSGIVIIRHVL
jgi:hypothetical protein